MVNNVVCNRIEKFEPIIKETQGKFNLIELKEEAISQNVQEIQERVIDLDIRFEQNEKKNRNDSMAKRKAITEMMNDSLNRHERKFEEHLNELICKMNSFEETSKDTNAKFLSLTTRVSEFIQEDTMRGKKYTFH
jgi:hypothetical protein